MKATCIIIDDEHPARVLLEDYVSKTSQLELAGSFSNPIEAIAFMDTRPVDIIFLDIQMPEMSGIELLKSMPKRPKVIFTTAYQNYALEGYDLNVVDYLVKPIKLERFFQAVNKASALLKLEQGGKPAPADQVISVKADHRIYRVNVANIQYVEGLKEYVRFHLESEKLITLESLKNLEETLPASSFIRIHKSYIVNKTKVKSIYGNQVQLDNSVYIPIGKLYRNEIMDRLFG